MRSRREILATGMGAGITALLASGHKTHAQETPGHVISATAITQVFGDGQKLTAVALEYDRPIDGSKLSTSTFRVEDRTVVGIHASESAAPAKPAAAGRYIIVELSLDDPAASLQIGGPGSHGLPGAGGGSPPRPGGSDGPPGPRGPDAGPPQFGPRQVYREAAASVIQSGPVTTVDGAIYAPSGAATATTDVSNLIVDEFRLLEFTDPKTGRTLKYNLFVPRGYDSRRFYPLVLFIHDAGTLSHDPSTTLKQGLGAVVWASPEDQAKHPAFVLAPQYVDVTVDDRSDASADLDTTVSLVDALASEYAIDRTRLYTTGQSMGAMMSLAMGIRHPDLFAASFIVAGQWDPARVAPLATQKLWIVVSQGDLKAYPGENAITAMLEKDGAKVSRAVWDGRSTPAEFTADVRRMEAEGSPINYVALERGTVVPLGQHDDGGSNHTNTWRIAYTIEGIRDWMFRQRR